jgi:hypothetical protein
MCGERSGLVGLEVELQRQEARLALAGVPDDLIKVFHDISNACWQYLQQSIEESAGVDPGINTGLLEARRLVHRALGAYLLREQRRARTEDLRREAIAATRRVLNDPNIREKLRRYST